MQFKTWNICCEPGTEMISANIINLANWSSVLTGEIHMSKRSRHEVWRRIKTNLILIHYMRNGHSCIYRRYTKSTGADSNVNFHRYKRRSGCCWRCSLLQTGRGISTTRWKCYLSKDICLPPIS